MHKPTRQLFALLLGLGAVWPAAQACTRALYQGPEDTIITVRSMDWMSDIGTNLWVMPRGVAREGLAGPGSVQWTSKYGSVIATAFDAATADGMNERGLVMNLLYLAESVYPTPAQDEKRLPLSLWGQYVLDLYGTVAEAVEALRAEPIYVVPMPTPDGHAGTAHISLSDPSGDSAILEYVDGKLVIHHGREYDVMTNSPTFDQQLALNTYWSKIGGENMLPGTHRAADRFARTSFYIKATTKTANSAEAVAAAFSVIRGSSVPLGVTTPGQPNVAATLWRTVADHKNRRYYYESVRSPLVFWVDFSDVDFSPAAGQRLLPVSKGELYSGNAAARFQPATPFAFLPGKPDTH
jgi:choloylglycine hydrolase